MTVREYILSHKVECVLIAVAGIYIVIRAVSFLGFLRGVFG